MDIRGSQDDYSSLRLIITILDECRKIGLNEKLKEKYMEKSKTLEKSGKISQAVRIWRDLLLRVDKYDWCDNHCDLPPNLQDDQHVIEPTLFLHGILVTTDDKLRRRVAEWAETKKLRLEVMSPKEAVDHLSKLKSKTQTN
jgi:hypothetical protein